MSLRAHRSRKLDQNVQRMMRSIRGGCGESEQRFEQHRTVRQARPFLIDDFYLLAFEHYDVRVLTETVEASMFDDKQSGLNIFKHKTVTRNRPRRSPNT